MIKNNNSWTNFLMSFKIRICCNLRLGDVFSLFVIDCIYTPKPYGGQVVELYVFLMVGRGSYPRTGCFFTVFFTVFFTLTHVAGSI